MEGKWKLNETKRTENIKKKNSCKFTDENSSNVKSEKNVDLGNILHFSFYHVIFNESATWLLNFRHGL